MPSITYDLEDAEIAMPNGQTLIVTSGELDIEYYIQPREPDVGIFSAWADWDLTRQSVRLVAMDENEREVRLVLPVRHPAIRRLLDRLEGRISDACMDDHEDWSSPDPDSWRDAQIDRELMER